MSSWICSTPGCGHNRSVHRFEWDKFRGVRDTSCGATLWDMRGSDRCRCGEFVDEKKETA